jgi:hypothetical protein
MATSVIECHLRLPRRIEVTLISSADAPADLTGKTVTVTFRCQPGGYLVTRTAYVDDPPNGVASYVLVPADFGSAADRRLHLGDFDLYWDDSDGIRYPGGAYDVLRVLP